MRPLRFLPLLALAPASLCAQTTSALDAERADFAAWLSTAPSSPYAAVLHQPIQDELVFGPGGHPALVDAPGARLVRGARGLRLETGEGTRLVPRNRPVSLGTWRLRASGSGRETVVTVFAPMDEPAEPPGWFAPAEGFAVEGTLVPPDAAAERRMLSLEGVAVTAALAGRIEGVVQGERFSLTVFRMPVPGSEEADLSVFFMDGTSGDETYPPGRFVDLRPLGGRRYRVDFNRARNPFCAYNPLFPCPLPWPGNVLETRVEAGELYEAIDG